jgi:hypothetical protein
MRSSAETILITRFDGFTVKAAFVRMKDVEAVRPCVSTPVVAVRTVQRAAPGRGNQSGSRETIESINHVRQHGDVPAMCTGWLIGTGFRRFGPGGLPFLVPAAVPLAGTAVLCRVGWLGDAANSMGIPRPPTAIGVSVSILIILIGFVVTHLLIRDLPAHGKPVLSTRTPDLRDRQVGVGRLVSGSITAARSASVSAAGGGVRAATERASGLSGWRADSG